MKKALLIIGDKKKARLTPARSFITFTRHINRLAPRGTEIRVVSYRNILNRNMPIIFSPYIYIISFFPFTYWNRQIEIYDMDKRIYGDRHFGEDYADFLLKMKKRISTAYKNKHINYFNPFEASLLERDKKRAKQVFMKNGINTPRLLHVRDAESIKRILERGQSIYAKPRFGAMGKGITYLSGGVCLTNFIYAKGKLVNRRSDYGWSFHEIDEGRRDGFLKQLIKNDVIFEEAVEHPLFRDKKFDFRVYVLYGKTPYYYIRLAPYYSPITNWAQGGRIEQKSRCLRYVSRNKLNEVRDLAVKVAHVLNLNYAGIDLVLSSDHKDIHCLEAHSFPGYEKGFDMMRAMAREIAKKM